MSIKPNQIQSILEYQTSLQNDISMLAWKVYSSRKINDDYYFDNLISSSGIDFGRSVGSYVSPVGGAGGYFKYLESSSGSVDYNFNSDNTIVRNPLQSIISNWSSDTRVGSFYKAITSLLTWATGRVSIRNRLSSLLFTNDGNAIRFKFEASTWGVRIDYASFGLWRVSTGVGIEGTPIPITFYDGSNGVSIAPDSYVWSDWIETDILNNRDYVLVLDLADGLIQYSRSTNLGYCMYQTSGTSYYISTPDEVNFSGGYPTYNDFIIPTDIEYAYGRKSGHFTSGSTSVSIGSGKTASEVEVGCQVELIDNTSGIISSIAGDGSSNFGVYLNTQLPSNAISGIYGSKYDSGSIKVTSNGSISPSSYIIQKGHSSLRINTSTPSYWDDLQVSIYKSNPGSSLIYHFISFDSQATWAVFTGSSWRTVARQYNSVWQYNNGTSGNVWVDAPSNTDLSALKSSLSNSLNRMTSDQLHALTSANWKSIGGFVTGQTSTLDFAFAMKASGSNIPYVSKYTVNYEINTTNVTFISQFWKSSQVNPKSAFCTLYVTTSNLMTLGTDIKAYISTNDGYDYDEFNLSLIKQIGTSFYLQGENSNLVQRGGNTIRLKVSTFNQKDIRVNAISAGLKY